MNEITLSDDLANLAVEIKGFKSNIGYSFYEIGRRLKSAKEKNSGHGEWKRFLAVVGFSRTQADRLITVFEEYAQGNLPDVGQIGLSLAYEIATLPEKQKAEQVQRVNDGEKIPVREIQELKRKNKEQEQQLKQQAEHHQRQLAEKDEVINKTYDQLKKAQQQETKVIEKEVIIEKVPDDYDKIKGLYEANKTSSDTYMKQNQELRAELKNLELLVNTQNLPSADNIELIERLKATITGLEKWIQELKEQIKSLEGE